jgi:hypothetical protein
VNASFVEVAFTVKVYAPPRLEAIRDLKSWEVAVVLISEPSYEPFL